MTQPAYLSSFPIQKQTFHHSLVGESNAIAGALCLIGVFLHIVLSDALLNSLGFHYSGDEGPFYEKLHPGTVCIFLSFFVLVWDRGNLIAQCIKIRREQPVASALLVLTVMLFFYMILRSGAAGTAFMIDTHMTVAICAIVLSYAPLSYCRKAVQLFVWVALLNSCIGIAESIGRFRIFTFYPDWVVLKENYFRASALRGHPLNNAMFTVIALFVALALRYSATQKAILVIVFTTSLVAFGGRVGLIFAVAGVLLTGCIEMRRRFIKRDLTMIQILVIAATVILVPLLFAGVLYGLIHSSVGERIAMHSQWDESADSRRLAFLVFDYMTFEDMMFGVSTNRIMDIAYQMNLTMPLSDIENPWILMFMYLGIILFPFWLIATLAFMYRLMKGQPLALKMAVLAYFVIASTSNSFGRKDSTYLIMVSAVICASRSLQFYKSGAFHIRGKLRR